MSKFLHKYWLAVLVVFLLAAGISVGVVAIVTQRGTDETEEVEAEEVEPDEVVVEMPTTPELIDFQPVVETWLNSLPSRVEVGLTIYDLDNEQVVASHNPDEVFNTASIYKLFFVYDGYMQIVQGTEKADDYFTTAYDDFHSGALTLGDCLDLMLRESYNACADPMRANASRFVRAEAIAGELGLQNTSSAGLYSTANDLTELLKLYYRHPDLDEASWIAIQDSMLNQPPTTYDWRQGLPSGFKVAKVYDKVGWNWTGSYWDPYNDASIIEFPEQNRHYVFVVLTRFLPNAGYVATLGTRFEARVLAEE